jgi:hypothetical protein
LTFRSKVRSKVAKTALRAEALVDVALGLMINTARTPSG